MHHRIVEQLAAGSSCIHRLDPRLKLLSVVGLIIATSVMPQEPLASFAVPAAMVITGLLFARLPLCFVLSRIAWMLPFVGVVAIFLPLTHGSRAIASWDALGIVVFREGLVLAVSILFKAAISVGAVCFLVFSTPFDRLLLAMRTLRFPKVVVMTLMFLFRYLDLVYDESQRVRRARASRSPGGIGRWRWRSSGAMVGGLFLRALNRAENVHLAMLARGFDGETKVLTAMKFGRGDVGFGLGVAFCAGLLTLLFVG